MTPGVVNPAPTGRRRRHTVRTPLTTRVGRWSANHPWLAIAAWLCFVVTSVIGGSLVGTVKATAQDSLHGELARADRIEQAGAVPDAPAAESILITAQTGDLDLQRAQAATADLSTRAAHGRRSWIGAVARGGDRWRAWLWASSPLQPGAAWSAVIAFAPSPPPIRASGPVCSRVKPRANPEF